MALFITIVLSVNSMKPTRFSLVCEIKGYQEILTHCVVVVTCGTRTVRALQGSHNALYRVTTLLTLSYVFKQYEKQNIPGKRYKKPLASSLIFVKRSPR